MKDLFDAIREQDLVKVEELMKQLPVKSKINKIINIEGAEYSPLTYAISELSSSSTTKDLQILKLLLKNKANPNLKVNGKYPLELAVNIGNIELIEIFLSHNAIISEKALADICLKATDKNLENSLQITELIIKELFFKKKYKTRIKAKEFVNHILDNSWKQSSEILKPFLELLYINFILIPQIYKSLPSEALIDLNAAFNYQFNINLSNAFNHQFNINLSNAFNLQFNVNLSNAFKFLIPLYNIKDQDPQILTNIREILSIILDLKNSQYLDNPELVRLLEQASEYKKKDNILQDNQDLLSAGLQVASRYCCKDIIELLFLKGAQLNGKKLYNYPPLIMLLKHSNSDFIDSKKFEIVKFFLQNGADPNQHSDNDNTPLLALIYNSSSTVSLDDKLDIMQLLINEGAKLDTYSDTRYTPLAALILDSKLKIPKDDKLKMIKLLIKNYANPYIEGHWQCLPIHHAIKTNDLDIVKYLLEKTPDLRKLDAKTLKLLSEADPELLAGSGIQVNNRFKTKIVEQDSNISTKLINLLNRVKLFLEETLFNIKKFFNESSVDYSQNITVSLTNSPDIDPGQENSLPTNSDNYKNVSKQNSSARSQQ